MTCTGPIHHVEDCSLLALPKIEDHRGNLTFIEQDHHVPFLIKRVFYIYDIPTAQQRGAHAHYKLNQFIVCLSGSVDVVLDDGRGTRTVHLNKPWEGLHIKPSIWASELSTSPGTVYLVLTDDYYDEADYIRAYDDFMMYRRRSDEHSR